MYDFGLRFWSAILVCDFKLSPSLKHVSQERKDCVGQVWQVSDSSTNLKIRKSTDDWPCFVSVLLSGSLLTLIDNITDSFRFVTPQTSQFPKNCHSSNGDTRPNPRVNKELRIFCVPLTNPARPMAKWGVSRATAPKIRHCRSNVSNR